MDEREADEAPWERNLKTRGRLLRRSTSHEDALRYYVYVSDTKIDQLFAQIPSKLLKKISIETSIDLKVIRLTVKQNPSEENRISRLRVVERFIHQKGEVGTVDQPAQWIQGTLNLRWGPLPRSVRDPLPTGLDPVRTSGDDFWTMPAEELGFVHSNVVFFVGRSDRNLIGMCGSMRHVLGAAPTTPNDPRTWGIGSVGFTTTSTLEAWLGQPIELESEPESLVDHSLPELPLPQALAIVTGKWKEAKVPRQKLVFLAKRLSAFPGMSAEESPSQKAIPGAVLATPLFVAQAD